jgi:hypothetical protein
LVAEQNAILAADVCLFFKEAIMSSTRFFKIHRSWEDWAGMLIGVLIGFSPWLAEQQGDQAVMWNAVLVGALVLALAQLEYVAHNAGRKPARLYLGYG